MCYEILSRIQYEYIVVLLKINKFVDLFTLSLSLSLSLSVYYYYYFFFFYGFGYDDIP